MKTYSDMIAQIIRMMNTHGLTLSQATQNCHAINPSRTMDVAMAGVDIEHGDTQ